MTKPHAGGETAPVVEAVSPPKAPELSDTLTQKLVNNFMISALQLGLPPSCVANHMISAAVGLTLAYATVDGTIGHLRSLQTVLKKAKKGKPRD